MRGARDGAPAVLRVWVDVTGGGNRSPVTRKKMMSHTGANPRSYSTRSSWSEPLEGNELLGGKKGKRVIVQLTEAFETVHGG